MVDVAKLVFDFDATSATAAEKRIDSLTAASDRLDQASKRVKVTVGGGAYESARSQAGAYEQSLKSLIGVYGQIRDAAGRFTAVDGAFRMSQEATAMTMIQNAKAVAALAKEQEQAAKLVAKAEADAARVRRAEMDATATLLIRNAKLQDDLAKEQERAASVTATYAKRVDALRSSMDPLAAVQVTLAQRTKLLDDAMAHGAIGADQHAALLSKVTRSALDGVEGINKYAGGLKNGAHYATNFSFQLNDIATGLLSGQKPMQIFAQQGGQVFQILQQAAVEAGSFKGAVKGLVAEVAPLLAAFGPWIAGLAAVSAGVWLLIRAHEEHMKRIEDVNKAIDDQSAKLSQTAPWLIEATKQSNLAADGTKNFHDWVVRNTAKLGDYKVALRDAAIEEARMNLFKAKNDQQKLVDENFKVVAGAPVYNGKGSSMWDILTGKSDQGFKEFEANFKKAKENVSAYTKELDGMLNAPTAAFAPQVAAAKAATVATGSLTKEIKLSTETVSAYNEIWPEATAAAQAYEKQQGALSLAQRDTIKTMQETIGLAPHMSSALESLAIDFERASKQAQDVRYSIEGIGYAIENGDWAGAFSGLFDALDQVKKAFADGATAADKFAAVSGIGQGIGALIGGKTGSAISGAASGAQAGFQLAGPWGAAAGAALGGLTSILGSSAEAAQKKLDALNQSVTDLRTANMASSGSVVNALEQATKLWNSDLEYSSAMVSSLRSIDSQIGSLANAVGKSIATGGLLSTSGLGLGTTASQGSALFGLANILLGGKKTTTELSDQGLQFNAGTYSQGVTGSTYADLVSTTTKKILGITTGVKVNSSTVTGSLDSDLIAQVNDVIKALGSGVIAAATSFGGAAADAATKALESAQIDIGKLSLKGLSASEIEDLLNATFSRVGDDLAKAGVPGLEALAQVGEGSFETLTRLAREYEVVDLAMQSIGKVFPVVGLGSIEARDRLVQLAGGLDDFASKTSYYAANFLTEAEQLAPVQNAVTIEMARLGYASVQTKDQFKALVQGIDVSTEAGAKLYASLITVAPAFVKVADYMDALQEPSQAVQDALADLSEAYDREASALKTVIAAVDDARSTLAAAYDRERAALLLTVGAVSGAASDLLDAYSRQAGALKAIVDKVSGAVSSVIDAYSQQATALQGIVDLVDSARDDLVTAYGREASAISATKSKFEDFAKSLKAFREGLDVGSAAGLSPEALYAASKTAFQDVSAKAAGGDQAALGDLQNVSQAYLDASRDYYASSKGYFDDLAAVKAATEAAVGYSQGQVDAAQAQLDTLNLILDSQDGVVDGIARLGDQTLVLQDGVFAVNSSALSIADAVTGFQAALLNSAVAQGQLDSLNLLLDAQDGVVDGIAHLGGQTLIMTDGIFAVNDNVQSVASALAAYQDAVINSVTAQAQLDALNHLLDAQDGLVDGIAHIGDQTLVLTDGIFVVNDSVLSVAAGLADFNGALADYQQAIIAASDAQAQIDRLDAAVAGIGGLTDTVVSFQEAMSAYLKAMSDASVAQTQLDALNAQVDGLLTVNQSVLSVAAAIALLGQAQAAQAAALQAALVAQAAAAVVPVTPVTPSTPEVATPRAADWSSYLTHYADVAAEYAKLDKAGLKSMYGISSAEQFAQWHYTQFGQSEGRTPYAKGGMFTNGIVSQPTEFDASIMGEGGRPEAIVPLVRGPAGLGIRSSGSGSDPAMLQQLQRIENVLEKLVVEAKADKTQRGAVARETLNVLGEVVEEVNGVKRKLAAAA